MAPSWWSMAGSSASDDCWCKMRLLPQGWQGGDPRQQMGIWGALELLTRVGTGEYANVPMDRGIPTGLQIEHRVPHVGYLVYARLADCFHGAENQIRRRAPLGDIITLEATPQGHRR